MATMPTPLALITGASSGIGAVFARKLAARSYDLLLVARRGDRLSALADELHHTHTIRAEILAADLATEAGIESTAAHIAAEDRLVLLVNNAGFGTTGRFWETSIAGQKAMHEVHVMATLRLTHAALQNMVPRNHGAIINVSSASAFVRGIGTVSYGATKTWMNTFTEGVYLELKGIGSHVQVQALCPGFTYTEFHDVQGVDRKLIPARWWMSADEVVEASLAGLHAGKLFVVPGLRYRLFAAIFPKLPVGLRLAIELRDRSYRGMMMDSGKR
ncbi:MAG TPA: SDR family oxidoreductase [Candidatus Eisenbacteria bacterium]|jgi:short-subunit dehydrogenase|nr:SDR family oxidoreductase [Candidatus Eisenbacteria bacterium]